MRYLFEYKGFALPSSGVKRAWIETFEWLWIRTFLYLFLKLERREDILEKALKEGVAFGSIRLDRRTSLLSCAGEKEEEPRRIAAS